jgi:hypothetical protein
MKIKCLFVLVCLFFYSVIVFSQNEIDRLCAKYKDKHIVYIQCTKSALFATSESDTKDSIKGYVSILRNSNDKPQSIKISDDRCKSDISYLCEITENLIKQKKQQGFKMIQEPLNLRSCFYNGKFNITSGITSSYYALLRKGSLYFEVKLQHNQYKSTGKAPWSDSLTFSFENRDDSRKDKKPEKKIEKFDF